MHKDKLGLEINDGDIVVMAYGANRSALDFFRVVRQTRKLIVVVYINAKRTPAREHRRYPHDVVKLVEEQEKALTLRILQGEL